MATLNEIVIAVRELAFDRFPIPEFILKQKTGKFVTNNNTNFRILPAAASPTPDYTYTYTPNVNDDTLQNLTDALVGNGYPVAYTGYYSALNKTVGLLKYTDASLATNLTFFRRFFLSDIQIQELIILYYDKVLCLTTTLVTLPTDITLLDNDSVRHLTLWVAINLVEKRRLSEVAASTFSMNFTDGTGAVAGSNLNHPGENITVSIGSVFSLTDDNSITAQYFQEDFNRVGSDNVLGDKESFWFKLFLWLRDRIEQEFGDFNFRKDNVIVGNIYLDKQLNYFAYFDSYPFTLSALARDIIS